MSWAADMLQSYIYNYICPHSLYNVTDEVISKILRHGSMDGSVVVQQLSSQLHIFYLFYFWIHPSLREDRSSWVCRAPPIFRHQGVCMCRPASLGSLLALEKYLET